MGARPGIEVRIDGPTGNSRVYLFDGPYKSTAQLRHSSSARLPTSASSFSGHAPPRPPTPSPPRPSLVPAPARYSRASPPAPLRPLVFFLRGSFTLIWPFADLLLEQVTQHRIPIPTPRHPRCLQLPHPPSQRTPNRPPFPPRPCASANAPSTCTQAQPPRQTPKPSMPSPAPRP